MLESLNEKQRQAAEIITGPVMVFAGAGSGKTRTLTYRIANMINHGIDPTSILAITFTNKATNEMRERLFNLVGPQASHLTISTFHSLCASILRREIKVLGYSNRFAIIDDEDQLKILTEVLENGNYNKKTYSPRYLRKKLNYCKCFDIKSSVPIENTIFNAYENLMKELNLLDFEDLLIKVREIFQNYPQILNKYQNKFYHILVDEFQDTDLIQYQIIKMLAMEHRNLFVVGDDDQSIYSFRGTNYENMKLFKRDFPEHQLIILNQNYRSTQTILDGCNRLISHNKDREPKELFSEIKGSSDDVVVYQARDHEDEVDYVIENIKSLLKNDYRYQDIAILYRNSAISRNFELKFVQANLPYRIFGGVSYLRRKEIKDVIAYLRLIVFSDDIQSFKRIVNVPSRGIGLKTLQKLLDYRKQEKKSLFEAIDSSQAIVGNKYHTLISFKEFIIDFQNRVDTTDLVTLYEQLLDESGYLQDLENDEAYEERLENLMEFKSILYNIENNGEIASRSDKLIAAFDEAILADDKLETQKQSHDGITLSTIHSVKGLEFKAVFIVAFENGIFPNINRLEDIDIEEERRIAYVAATRAKNKLFLTCATKRLLYGYYTYNMQSQFLLEFVNYQKSNKEEKVEVVSEEVKSPTKYQVGDKVIHTIYGEGIIVSLKDTIGQICFASKGMIKQFDMTHPTISKKEE